MRKMELAMLGTIGLLLVVVMRLESVTPGEYTPLPSVLVSAEEPAVCIGQWRDATQTVITSDKEGTYKVRVRVQLSGTETGQEAGHAAFVVNRQSWIDGEDGWLYYQGTLEKDEQTDPLCLQGYLDSQGIEEQIYASVICEWKQVEEAVS